MTIAVDLGRKATKQTNNQDCAKLAWCFEDDFQWFIVAGSEFTIAQ